MTAEDLLARAKTWTQQPAGPGRTRASYRLYFPAIDHLAAQGWRPIRIKEAIAREAKLDAKASQRLYDVITRRLRQ